MNTSICIVSKNRKAELRKTLTILTGLVKEIGQEILVFLDGCDDGSEELLKEFPKVQWFESSQSIGASPARRILFAQASGTIIFGFDDDAHPLNTDFIKQTQAIFDKNTNTGVLAFEEIKGIFSNDREALELHQPDVTYKCNSFVGCGFAIKKEAYEQTAGFPEWMDIYGEEGAVSIQLIDAGYDILYTSEIAVNHRVDRKKRKTGGGNVFRFERQLCNMGLYFIIFYPASLLPRKLIKLHWHNLRTYAFTDASFFKAYFKGIFRFVLKLPEGIRHRKPVRAGTIEKINRLPHPKYG